MSGSAEKYIAVQLATDLPVAVTPRALALYGTNVITGAVEQAVAGVFLDAAIADGASQMLVQQLGAGAVARTVQGKLRDSVSPMDFGAIGDGVANDTAAMQAAVDAIRGTGRWLDGGGKTYKVCVLPDPMHIYGNYATTYVYGAVRLGAGNVQFRNMRTVLGFTAGIPAGSLSYMFSSDKNMTIGTISDVIFDDVTWDVNNAFGFTQQNPRSVYIVGGAGIWFRNCFQTSSGPRDSGSITLQNCDGVFVLGHRHRNTVQGFAWSYVRNWTIADCSFDNFSEAIDFDLCVTDGVANNVRFKNGITGGGRNGQCWDMNSIARAVITNVVAEDTGNIFWVNYKTTTWNTYADFVASTFGATNPDLSAVNAQDVTIRGVRGQRICLDGGGGFAISLGNDRNEEARFIGQPNNRSITLEDVYIKDSTGIMVWEGEDFILRRIKLDGVVGINSNSYGGLTAMQQRDDAQSTADSKLSILMEDIEVINAGNIGIMVSGPTKATLRRIKVNGYNLTNGATTQYGLWVRYLDLKGADVTLEDIDVSGGALTVAPTDLRIQDFGLANYRVRMLGEFKLAGPNPLLVTRIDTLRIGKQVELGIVDARSLAVVSADDVAETLSLSAADYMRFPPVSRAMLRVVGGTLPSGLSSGIYYGARKLTTEPLVQLTLALNDPYGGATRTFIGAGTGTIYVDLARQSFVHTAQGVERFIGLRLIAGMAFIADATNFAQVAVRRVRAGETATIASLNLNSTVLDGGVFYTTPISFGTPANADLIKGDVIKLDIMGAGGAGVYFPGVTAEVYVLRRE